MPTSYASTRSGGGSRLPSPRTRAGASSASSRIACSRSPTWSAPIRLRSALRHLIPTVAPVGLDGRHGELPEMALHGLGTPVEAVDAERLVRDVAAPLPPPQQLLAGLRLDVEDGRLPRAGALKRRVRDGQELGQALSLREFHGPGLDQFP